MPVVLVTVIRPTLFITRSRVRLSLFSALDLLQTRIVPGKMPPVMDLGIPSAPKETYGRLPLITMPTGMAALTETTFSPVSTAAVVPLRVVSINEIQPCSKVPVLAQEVPSELGHKVIRFPVFIALDLAWANAETMSLVAEVRRDDAISP